MSAPRWTYNDGGRAAAGFKGKARDCVARAVSIATGADYSSVLAELTEENGGLDASKGMRDKATTRRYLAARGWVWTPTMKVGQGCRTHLRADELPGGLLLASCSRHLVAVIDGIAQDTHDSTRRGMRCVYGYWTAAPKGSASR